jgi:hypothetical protein
MHTLTMSQVSQKTLRMVKGKIQAKFVQKLKKYLIYMILNDLFMKRYNQTLQLQFSDAKIEPNAFSVQFSDTMV